MSCSVDCHQTRDVLVELRTNVNIVVRLVNVIVKTRCHGHQRVGGSLTLEEPDGRVGRVGIDACEEDGTESALNSDDVSRQQEGGVRHDHRPHRRQVGQNNDRQRPVQQGRSDSRVRKNFVGERDGVVDDLSSQKPEIVL